MAPAHRNAGDLRIDRSGVSSKVEAFFGVAGAARGLSHHERLTRQRSKLPRKSV
ncbi:hypothetical protein ACFPME_13240 [Rhodanobacter umsongensis]|uniref:Uncharacterized protein n=1 Tax=Rhodanobacter umsongensis TaxID=633153 RepID=A0ABW0JN64_9GAMM